MENRSLVSPLTELDRELRSEYLEFRKSYLSENSATHLWSFEKYLIYQVYELKQRLESGNGNSDSGKFA